MFKEKLNRANCGVGLDLVEDLLGFESPKPERLADALVM
jgi:hypothetical protein